MPDKLRLLRNNFCALNHFCRTITVIYIYIVICIFPHLAFYKGDSSSIIKIAINYDLNWLFILRNINVSGLFFKTNLEELLAMV